MSAAAEPSNAAVAESLLAFWADAGVDAMLLDEPFDRIEAGKVMPPTRPAAPTVVPSTAPVGRVATPQPDISTALAQAQAAAAAAQDLDALVAAIAAFEGCPLRYEGAATQAVVYRGDPKAPLMVIGEGPGADEDVMGQPFVGRAGLLLDRMFAAIGLSRTSPDAEAALYITNVMPWRPPGNRDPEPAEIAMMRPLVERHIALVDPAVIVVMGNMPLFALTGTKGIQRARGTWSLALGKPLLPMLHPERILSNPLAKREAWADLLSLQARLR